MSDEDKDQPDITKALAVFANSPALDALRESVANMQRVSEEVASRMPPMKTSYAWEWKEPVEVVKPYDPTLKEMQRGNALTEAMLDVIKKQADATFSLARSQEDSNRRMIGMTAAILFVTLAALGLSAVALWG